MTVIVQGYCTDPAFSHKQKSVRRANDKPVNWFLIMGKVTIATNRKITEQIEKY